jgi:hypothetical protein
VSDFANNSASINLPNTSPWLRHWQAVVVVLVSLVPWLVPLVKTTALPRDSTWSSSSQDGPSLRVALPSPSLPHQQPVVGPLPLPLPVLLVAWVGFLGLVVALPRPSRQLWLHWGKLQLDGG